jgi:hypothetical protein
MGYCRRCTTDLAHCHGTLVRHEDGSWECTAEVPDATGKPPGRCAGDVVAHDFVLRCADQCGCCEDPLAQHAAGSGRMAVSA